MSELKITIVTPEEQEYDFENDNEWRPPSTYYFIDALGNSIFIHTRQRSIAQKYIDDNYGKNYYTIRAAKLSKGNGSVTCSGSQTTRGQKR